MKVYKIIFEDYDHNELWSRIKEFTNKKEAEKYAKEMIATTSDDSHYFRIIKV
jgi:hypothetical protein